jgi:glycosyltransferase involved in cell wall biosynthesis
MRILMIGQKGVPARSGGVERHVDELCIRLASAGHEVLVYCRRAYVKDPDLLSYNGVQLVYLPTFCSKHLETVIHTFLASVHALFQNADIIHYHGIGPSIFVWIPRLFARRTRVIATFHCQDYYHKKWKIFAQAVFRVGEYMACTWTHATIVVSQTLQEYVQARYGRQSVLIPNAVALSERKTADRIREFGLVREGYILSVSRLIPHKGVHTIIEAYRAISRRRLDMPQLVIAGGSSFTDEYAAHLKQIADGDPRILFLGEQPSDILAELYSNARFFVQASETEGLSYALLEAMSYGCPVIVSDIRENREVVPSQGMTFQTGNSGDLSVKMEVALDTDHSCAHELQAHVLRYYNVESVLPSVMKTYTAAGGRAEGIA